MPGSGLLHLKREGKGRAEQGMRAAVGGVRRRGEAEVPADRGRDAIQGWARRRKGDEGEAGKALAKSKFEEPKKRRGRKKI